MSTEVAKQNMALERVATAVPTEVGTTAAAAQQRALVEAQFIMAARFPRVPLQVRAELLKECSRPSFALETEPGKGNSALYRKPVGGGKFAEGLGIRFAEVAMRCFKNLEAGAITIQDDENERVKLCYVLDLESNILWKDTVTISKVVERLEPKPGDVILSSRINSRGIKTFLIPASEDALITKEAAAISKKMRTLILRVIPGDLQDQCEEEIRRVRREKITEDPDAALHKIVDGMGRQNVNVIMLEEYLGHPIQQITPAEVLNLQGLYGALRDGETTWAEIMTDIEESRKLKPKSKKGDGEASSETPAAGNASDKGVAAVKAKAEVEKKKEPAAPQQGVKVTEPAKPAQQTASPTPAPAEPVPPQPAPAESAPEPVAATLTSQPATPEEPAPVAEAPPAPATVAPAGETDSDGSAKLDGKIIRQISFPSTMNAASADDRATPAQRAEAEREFARLNLNPQVFLEKRFIKDGYQADFENLSATAMERLVKLLKGV